MAHINSIGAGLFSTIMISQAAAASTTSLPELASGFSEANWNTVFSDSSATRTGTGITTATAQPFHIITDLREIPAFGTPANIVNVPVYGQDTSSQIQAQADSPSLEVTLNYVPSEWSGAVANSLNTYLTNRTQVLIGIVMANSSVSNSRSAASYNRTTAAIGTVQNSATFFVGRMEALQVTPSLSDTNQATLTISTQSSFYGPFTV